MGELTGVEGKKTSVVYDVSTLYLPTKITCRSIIKSHVKSNFSELFLFHFDPGRYIRTPIFGLREYVIGIFAPSHYITNTYKPRSKTVTANAGPVIFTTPRPANAGEAGSSSSSSPEFSFTRQPIIVFHLQSL